MIKLMILILKMCMVKFMFRNKVLPEEETLGEKLPLGPSEVCRDTHNMSQSENTHTHTLLV